MREFPAMKQGVNTCGMSRVPPRSDVALRIISRKEVLLRKKIGFVVVKLTSIVSRSKEIEAHKTVCI